jgi:histidyl-tRNA synthetase
MADDMQDKEYVSTDGYKGVRDFYPPDMFIQNYLFKTMRHAVESFGYVEYSASILEPTELYKAKSGEEIVNEQTYSFKDRGDRDVTLRPEMTPTVARMVAAKKRELAFPLRWYSIPNLFRYEKPQRGRLREHFQLNVDLFGVTDVNAEIEIISVAHAIMQAYGARPDDFQIRINNRQILNFIMTSVFDLTDEDSYKLMKLIDKKDKITPAEFELQTETVLKEKTMTFVSMLEASSLEQFKSILQNTFSTEAIGLTELEILFKALAERGITNAVFSPTLARGFDYYTGIVFEVFDLNPENRRSLFGGGRYDDLLSVFGTEKVPAVGFGMGDVTIRDFLESRSLMPPYHSTTDLYICRVTENNDKEVYDVAQELRKKGLCVAIDFSSKKVPDQIKTASKLAIPFIIVIGEDEIQTKQYKLKNLLSGQETMVSLEEIAQTIKRGV